MFVTSQTYVYLLNKSRLSDINECTIFNNLCVNGMCENLIGNYRCLCNNGFRPDASGGNCSGINSILISLKIKFHPNVGYLKP